MKTELYIYDVENNKHLATITGIDNQDCENEAMKFFNTDDHGFTYTPAFGFSSGLIESLKAEIFYTEKYSESLKDDSENWNQSINLDLTGL